MMDEMVPKKIYDKVVEDRRRIAVDNIKLEKEIADLKKKIQVLEDEIEKLKNK